MLLHIQDPSYTNQALLSPKGGFLQIGDLHIQANNISFQEIDGEKVLIASENLLIRYRNKFCIGDSFSYNLATKTGTLSQGIFHTKNIFTGGEEIVFHEDNSVDITKAFFTTDMEDSSSWSVQSSSMHINPNYRMNAENITLQAFDTPCFWLPKGSMTVNKKYKVEPVLATRAFLENKKPFLLLRWRFLDNYGCKAYLRGEYRMPKDLGSTLEFNHTTQASSLETRNFCIWDSNQTQLRYRAQGIFSSKNLQNKVETYCQWDVLSDSTVLKDFPVQLSSLETLENTEAWIKADYDPFFAFVEIKPQVQNYQTVLQKLPECTWKLSPTNLFKSGIFWQASFSCGYWEQSFDESLSLDAYRSSKISTEHKLYKSLFLGPFSITPLISAQTTRYGNTPSDISIIQSHAKHHTEIKIPLIKHFARFSHFIEPTVDCINYFPLQTSLEEPYIFNTSDGFYPTHQVQIGLKNAIYFNLSNEPNFFLETSCIHFYQTNDFVKIFPKMQLNVGCNISQLTLTSNWLYNAEKHAIDKACMRLTHTFNAFFALSLEGRYCGEHVWKTNSPGSYMLDVKYAQQSHIPNFLQEERQTLLARVECNLSPLCMAQVYTQIGHNFTKHSIDLYTIVSSCWKVKFSYARAFGENQFSFGVELL